MLAQMHPLFELGQLLPLPLNLLYHNGITPIHLEDNVMNHHTRALSFSSFEIIKGAFYLSEGQQLEKRVPGDVTAPAPSYCPVQAVSRRSRSGGDTHQATPDAD